MIVSPDSVAIPELFADFVAEQDAVEGVWKKALESFADMVTPNVKLLPAENPVGAKQRTKHAFLMNIGVAIGVTTYAVRRGAITPEQYRVRIRDILQLAAQASKVHTMMTGTATAEVLRPR